VVQVELPPLRARSADIPALVRHFALELGVHSIDDEVIAEFANRPWPGNVRELKNAVRAYLAVGSVVPATATVHPGLDEALCESIDLSRPYSELKERLLERFQYLYLDLLMTRTAGNQSEAARVSGLDRSYLNRVLRRLG
jgi:DNA-binding NtrC family response regulator